MLRSCQFGPSGLLFTFSFQEIKQNFTRITYTQLVSYLHVLVTIISTFVKNDRLASAKASRCVVWCGLSLERKSKRSTIYSDCSMSRKHCKSRSVSCVANSMQLSCRKCSCDSRMMSSSMLSGSRGSVWASCFI